MTESKTHLQERIYQCIHYAIFYRGEFKVNRHIDSIVCVLHNKYNIDKEDLEYQLFEIAMSRKLDKKYHWIKDGKKRSLSAYVSRFVFKELLNMKRKLDYQYNKQSRRQIELSMDEIMERDDKVGNLMDFLCDPHDPESLYSAKQLFEVSISKFGRINSLVLFGDLSISEGAKLLDKPYSSFRRIILNQRSELQDLLISEGYDVDLISGELS